LAIDPAVVLLSAGIIVLCATTAITALSLPSFRPHWRRRRRPAFDVIPMTYRRPAATVSGRTPLALPAAPGHRRWPPDDPDRVDDIDTAWALIERLLEHDPHRLVDVLTTWIADDLPGPETVVAPEENRPS
jgi:hypothetical protein